MKTFQIGIFVGAMACAAALSMAASAEPYVDYTPEKGVWHVVEVKVDPNHIDDYIVGLRKTWVPGEEIAKKHGVIDSFNIKIKMNASDGRANVRLIEHYPSAAMMDPDRARDQAIDAEVKATLSKSAEQAQIAAYEKYRVFVGEDYWTDITLAK